MSYDVTRIEERHRVVLEVAHVGEQTTIRADLVLHLAPSVVDPADRVSVMDLDVRWVHASNPSSVPILVRCPMPTELDYTERQPSIFDARQVVALPGAPQFERRAVSGYRSTSGASRVRAPDGLGWMLDPATRMWYVPDLTDDATGGVMLAALPDDYHLHRSGDVWTFHDADGHTVGDGPTLAAACARVMVARGRW